MICTKHTVHRWIRRYRKKSSNNNKKTHREETKNNVLHLLLLTRPSANIFPNDMHAILKEKIGVVCHR